MRSLVKVSSVVLCALACASLSACSAKEQIDGLKLPEAFGVQTSVDEALSHKQVALHPAVSDDQLIEAGYLTVGIRANALAPFSYKTVDAQDGMDYYVGRALAEAMGLKVKFVHVSAANAAGSKCDVVMDTKDSETGSFVVVGGYAQSAASFFTKGEEEKLSADSLSGKSVGLQSGSVSADALNRTNLNVNVKGYENLNDAFAALSAGSVNYVLSDLYSGMYLATDFEGIRPVATLDAPHTIGVAVASDKVDLQQAVNDAMGKLGSNGQLDIIKNVWVGGTDPINKDSVVANVGVNAAYEANKTMAESTNN